MENFFRSGSVPDGEFTKTIYGLIRDGKYMDVSTHTKFYPFR